MPSSEVAPELDNTRSNSDILPTYELQLSSQHLQFIVSTLSQRGVISGLEVSVGSVSTNVVLTITEGYSSINGTIVHQKEDVSLTVSASDLSKYIIVYQKFDRTQLDNDPVYGYEISDGFPTEEELTTVRGTSNIILSLFRFISLASDGLEFLSVRDKASLGSYEGGEKTTEILDRLVRNSNDGIIFTGDYEDAVSVEKSATSYPFVLSASVEGVSLLRGASIHFVDNLTKGLFTVNESLFERTRVITNGIVSLGVFRNSYGEKSYKDFSPDDTRLRKYITSQIILPN